MGVFENLKVQKNVKAALKQDPLFVQKVSREKQIVFDSVSVMEKSTSAYTLIHQYENGIAAIDRFNSLVVSVGEDPCEDVRADIIAVFCRVLPDAVKGEVDAALALKTSKGRRDRLRALLDVIERCNREEGDVVDMAIGTARSQIFTVLEAGVDWSKEADADLSVCPDKVMEAIQAALVDSEKGDYV